MSLRAGYYGVKRFLRDKLEMIAGTYDETIKSLFPYSEQAVLGARNFVPVPYYDETSKTQNNVTFNVNEDGSISVSISESASANTYFYISISGVKLTEHSYRINSGLVNDKVSFEYHDKLSGGSWANEAISYGENKIFTPRENITDQGIWLIVHSGATGSFVVKPLITLSSDLTLEYSTPDVKTNKELTESVADQKTAINAIITAATGAADFAAFKTAMGAITPVTRSLSLTKDDITEEVKEDVEPEKTVTKKRTTKKTEEV